MTENLVLRTSPSAKYTWSYNTGSNLDPLKVQKALTLLNEVYYQVVVDQPLQTGAYAAFLGQPRFRCVTLRAKS